MLTTTASPHDDYGHSEELIVIVIFILLKATAIIVIIAGSLLGNTLVVLSIIRFERLRTFTNYFILSLAIADFFVTLIPMTFNASSDITGKWYFDELTCDFMNACAVYFCTVSILHLCCISADRYYAITNPLYYHSIINEKTVKAMLAGIWIIPTLISYLPVFMNWHTTADFLAYRKEHSQYCALEVNTTFAIVSSSVSFWIPGSLMALKYKEIYLVARRQAKVDQVWKKTTCLHHPPFLKSRSASADNFGLDNKRKRHKVVAVLTSLKCEKVLRMRSECKADKTIALIMGAFLLCWFPFFVWYLTKALYKRTWRSYAFIERILMWVGFANSAVNPIIYGFFNHDFQVSFEKLLTITKSLNKY